MRPPIRGDDVVPDAQLHPAIHAVLLALGSYKRLSTGPLATAPGHPKPPHRNGLNQEVTVVSVAQVAEDVVSLTLVSQGGGDLPRWRPGAHLDVFLPSGLQRQYSLCGDPRDRSRYRIAVRLVRDGGGASREIHEQLRVGDSIRISVPRNAFHMADSPSYHLIAGGIGITPILPMIHAAHARGKPWRLVYTGRTRVSMPFLDELAGLPSGAIQIRPDDEFGQPTATHLLAEVTAADAVYACGPPQMLEAARAGFGTIIRELHTERFSAAPVVGGRPFDVELRRTGVSAVVGKGDSLLTAVRRVKPDVAYSCQQGFCGSCKVPVLAGRVEHRDHLLSAAEQLDSMLICVSRCDGPLVLDL